MNDQQPATSNLATAHWPRWLTLIASALTHDYCPSANRFVYWLKHPLAVLALAAAVSLVIGLLVAPQGYVVCGAITTVMVLGVLWPWLGAIGLRSELHFERRRAREGERVSATLIVTNRMPWPAWGLVLEQGFFPVLSKHQQTGDSPEVDNVALALARVPGFSRSEFSWSFEPTCRGEYPLTTPQLTTSFPFGLWKRGKHVSVQSKLLVWPRIVTLEALPLDQGSRWTLGALSSRRAGHEGEVIGTRRYRPGDLLRHVHWAQTARQGQMIVCERQACLTSSVKVIIDTRPQSHFGEGPDSSLEWTLRTAASVCESFLAHDIALSIELDGSTHSIAPGSAGQQRLNDMLARFQLGTKSARTAHSAKGSRGKSASELEVEITTNLAPSQSPMGKDHHRRRIVLHDAGSALATIDKSSSSSDRGWLQLDLAGDVASQLRLQWGKACRDA